MTNKIYIDGVSSANHQLFFDTLPIFPIAIETVNTIKIPGRNNTLHQKTEEFQDLSVQFRAVHVGLNVDDIVSWISNGKKLEMDSVPGRYALIKGATAYNPKRLGKGAIEFSLTIKIDPFKYDKASEAWDLDKAEFFAVPNKISVSGNYEALPILLMSEVESGTEITLNGVKVKITADVETIVFDVENKVVYQMLSDDTKIIAQNITEGAFWEWKLFPGNDNYIEMNKGIIMMWKNERWL